MKYNGIELEEMTSEKWDGKSREMLVWDDESTCPYKEIVIGYNPDDNYWIADDGYYWHHCAEIPAEEKEACSEIENLKAENDELKAKIKTLSDERIKMADSVSNAVWKEMMERVAKQESLISVKMPNGLGFNDISDIVLNKIIDYKPGKKLRRMTYKELDEWLEQGKGVVKIANHVSNTITYDCEDKNKEVYGGYKICGYDEDTWHYPMIEV